MFPEKEARKRTHNIRNELLDWAKIGLRAYPWREDRTPYSVMVAEFLLRRTTAQAVSRMFREFIKTYPEVRALAEANEKELEENLRTIGYHKLRAHQIRESADYVVKAFHGDIPRDLDKLLSIPHVGSYTAGAILSFGFNIPSSIVDSNIERIIKRIFSNSVPTHMTPSSVKQLAEILVPKRHHDIFNFALLDLGGTVCTPRRTLCEKCPLQSCCNTAIRDRARKTRRVTRIESKANSRDNRNHNS